ncbi:tetratricopeptide repeat protein 6 isoform X3 [Prionailurus viverrinus]|uniref:tetratricopeptide repeat protein 6 isoform X3 n=1 Tax=Prionailurus viverrinus TaxID=61388 RepID=UPI001FF64790|nr:tetratricopeptide repeat protein 6 isoform X3 [Prionailurus viverrinus]
MKLQATTEKSTEIYRERSAVGCFSSCGHSAAILNSLCWGVRQQTFQDRLVKMSAISKHFGLKYKEESYIFKELEKIRQETKKDFLRFKQKLASKPAVDEGPVLGLQVPGPARPGEKGSASCAGPAKPSGSPRAKSPTTPAAALPQQAPRGAARPPGPSEAATPGKTRPFRPQDFYLRSSAFLRHRPQKKPPVIASRAGTSRPVVLMPPPAPRERPGPRRGPRSPRPTASKPVLHPAPEGDAKRETAPLAEALLAKPRKGSSISSQEDDAEACSRLWRARSRTPSLGEGSVSLPREGARPVSKSQRERIAPSHSLEAPQQVRVIPTCIEEVIASLQSEAQLTSDRTIKELIQSVLGQHYDMKMEDTSLMGKEYGHKPSQVPAEQGLQNVLEELPETLSSIFQLEQEDVLEWGVSETESIVFKSQETLEVQPADESSKLLKDEQPIGDSKAAKSLKVKSSEFLQIRGKEAKQTQKSKLGIPQQRQGRCTKPQQDQKLPKKKIPQDYPSSTLHDLCTSVPAQQLPVNLHLASRVYHTADKKGHSTLLGILGTSFLDDHTTDEECRDRILQGNPVVGDNQEHVAILPTPPVILPDLAQGTRQRAQKPHLQLLGEEVSAYPGCTKLFWNPTSPKFSVPVSVMKEILYPKYESVQASKILIEKFSSESKESVALNRHSRSSRFLFLKKSASFESIQKCFSTPFPQLKRVKSAVELRKEETITPLEIKDDMQSNMKQILFQKAKELERWMTQQSETEEAIPVKENIDTILDHIQNRSNVRDLSLSLIEASRKAGISYIVYPKKKKTKWKKRLKLSKLSNVYDELSKPPKVLKRSTSHGILPGQKKYLLRVPLYERKFQCPSLPSCLNFDEFVQSKGGIPENTNPRTWALDMFSKHKHQKTTTHKRFKISIHNDTSERMKEPPKLELSDSLKSGLSPEVTKYYESEVEILTKEINDKKKYPAFAYCRRGAIYRKLGKLQSALKDLQEAILLEPLFLNAYWHRHFIYLFQDKINEALDDLNYVNKYNKNNAEAYLSKAEIFRGRKDITLAILNYTQAIKCKPTDADIYFRRGEMYEIANKVLAIDDFSKCIFYDPKRTDALLKRGMFYYENENWISAIQDFTALLNIDPQNSQARGQYLLMMKCYDLAKFTIYQVAEMNKGLIELSPIQQALIYSFCENHDKAIQVLDRITLNRPELTMYTLLAKAQMKAKKIKEAMRMFKKALDIFSHSDKGPNAIAASADCLYNLGLCYMEEGNIQMAFDCFTKAVKANPDFAEGFYQRGLCKVKLNKDSSVLDFNRAITLNPKHYQAYLSRVAFYGLKGRYSKAILNCNEAIKIYPQSVRAYIYRGVLKYYNKTYKLAITDLTTAINMDKNSYIAFYNRALCYTKISELRMALTDYGIVLLLDAGETVMLNTFINRGLIYVELEQYTFALEDFKQAALISKTNVSLCQATAMCHHRNKEFEEAVDFFTWALKIDPCFLDAYVGRGNSYMEYGHDEATKQAQKDFLKVLRINPTYTKARISLGYNLQAQGKFQKAWNHFTVAIEVDPKCCLAYEGRAVVSLQMGDNFAAIQDINAAIKINTTAEFLTNRGVIHEFMGQQQNAMKDYQAAISLNPTYSLAYFNAGNIYFHHRQFSQASDYFSKALKFDPENECAAMNRAIANTILKKYKEAKEDFAYVVESCPFWAAVYFNRAHFYCCLKQYELAEGDLSRALSLKPDDALIYNRRAEVRGRIGLIEEAVADYIQALDLQEYAPVM